MTTNGKGDDISVNTPWTGAILDSSYFKKPEYSQYRDKNNIKVPFWLQPVKYYKGVAWYQKTVDVPKSWQGKLVELLIERAHWETMLWIDNEFVEMQNSLATPHRFLIRKELSPGPHKITIRVDNRVKDIDVGLNSHSISDHTQTNWNGLVGNLELRSVSRAYIDRVDIYTDVPSKKIIAKVSVLNHGTPSTTASLIANVISVNTGSTPVRNSKKEFRLQNGLNTLEVEYSLGENVLLWNEFDPNLYTLNLDLLVGKQKIDDQSETFGVRHLSSKDRQFTVNGTPIFLRGTLECAIFPKTGYPPTDKAQWKRIFAICKSYGLNHIRFHSWCPPEAAFDVADSMGFYLQIESSSWANWSTSIGDGKPVDKFIYEESERIIREYGNHPSFCFFTYGNEPGGKNHVNYLNEFVKYWKDKDDRRQYTAGAGWPVTQENQYHNTPDPRIQHWGEGLKSIINSKPPSFDYDWFEITGKWNVPTISHEIGQWCVFPDLKEISQYDGVLKANNFEIFRNTLQKNGLSHLADSFLLASGKLQVLCYKADIEAALRTKNFGGFQLLDLHDFPGQGTALVGVLNPFWKEKGYVTPQEFSSFCNSVVPLARLPKMTYLNNEALSIPVEVANFSEAMIEAEATWDIKDSRGEVIFNGKFGVTKVPVGNGVNIGKITQPLSAVKQASRLTLTVSINSFKNAWDIFVYPARLPETNTDILVTDQFDKNAIEKLNKGGKVLLSLKKGSVKADMGGDVAVGFSSIFWNTAWTKGQAPHTLGILCSPQHPAFADFPTQFHSNWQWWDAMSHSNVIRLDLVDATLQPIVRVIDDWVTSRPLGLIFECNVGKGKLLVSGIDLLSNNSERPEARQLLHSLKKYMSEHKFAPKVNVNPTRIVSIMQ
jgi:hypothetical protein